LKIKTYVLLLDILGTCGVIRFWAFTPLMLQTYNDLHPETTFNIPVLSFIISLFGGLRLVYLSGYLSETYGFEQLHL
jgi:hypothetical protein